MLIFLLARIMHTMMYRFEGFKSGTPLMVGQILATAVEALLAIPAVIYFTKYPGPPEPGNEKIVRAVTILWTVYFTVIAGGTVALFAEFLQIKFADTVLPAAAAIIVCAAAAYCAWGGIEGLARAGTVVFWLFAVLVAAMAVVNEGRPEALNLRPFAEGDGQRMFSYFIESLSSAWWLPMLAVLGGYLRSGAAKAAYGFLALKFIIIEALILLITLILWRYVDVLSYPILALGAYAKSDFIQRFDAINMFVWAINCVIVCGVYVLIASRPSKRPKVGAAAAAAAAAAFGLWQFKRGMRFDETWLLWFKIVGIVLLGVVLPTAGLIIRSVKKAEKEYIK